jgi:hypothetical protein
MACASTPHALVSRFSEEYFSARSGSLRYRLPDGWLNSTNDAPSPDVLIWLVRADFAAMLSVREVMIDEETRSEITRSGLERLGDLTLSLPSSSKGISVVQRPTLSTVAGLKACRYDYAETGSGDRVHIMLMDTGKKVYEVSTRMTSKVSEEATKEIVLLAAAFAEKVLW